MAQRSFIDASYTLIKREVRLYCTLSISGDATPIPTLFKWNYPAIQPDANARTYTAASVAANVGAGAWPKQTQSGTEGVYSVVRTAIGLYTLKLQDNYQRLVDMRAYPSGTGLPIFATFSELSSATNTAAAGGATVGLAFWSFLGAAIDPVGIVRVALVLADATEP